MDSKLAVETNEQWDKQQRQSSVVSLGEQAPEILTHIFGFLGPLDQKRLASTNQRIKEIHRKNNQLPISIKPIDEHGNWRLIFSVILLSLSILLYLYMPVSAIIKDVFIGFIVFGSLCTMASLSICRSKYKNRARDRAYVALIDQILIDPTQLTKTQFEACDLSENCSRRAHENFHEDFEEEWKMELEEIVKSKAVTIKRLKFIYANLLDYYKSKAKSESILKSLDNYKKILILIDRAGERFIVFPENMPHIGLLWPFSSEHKKVSLTEKLQFAKYTEDSSDYFINTENVNSYVYLRVAISQLQEILENGPGDGIKKEEDAKEDVSEKMGLANLAKYLPREERLLADEKFPTARTQAVASNSAGFFGASSRAAAGAAEGSRYGSFADSSESLYEPVN